MKDFLTVNVKYCGFYLAQRKHPPKKKKEIRVICEIFETKYNDTSFQVADRTVIIPRKKNYLSENLWRNSGEK